MVLEKNNSYDLATFIGGDSDTTPNLLYIGGSIIVYQDAVTNKVKSVADLLNIPTQIWVFPDVDGTASGTMVSDDGIVYVANEYEGDKYREYNFVYSNHIMKINILQGFNYAQQFPYELFTSLIIADPSVNQGTKATACLFDSQMNIR